MRRKEKWYWCQEHERAEPRKDVCARDRRLGPYPSREAAENWRELHGEREERWQEQEDEWAGEGDEEGDDEGADAASQD